MFSLGWALTTGTRGVKEDSLIPSYSTWPPWRITPCSYPPGPHIHQTRLPSPWLTCPEIRLLHSSTFICTWMNSSTWLLSWRTRKGRNSLITQNCLLKKILKWSVFHFWVESLVLATQSECCMRRRSSVEEVECFLIDMIGAPWKNILSLSGSLGTNKLSALFSL